MSERDLFRGRGVEVKLDDAEDFLKVKETLTRIGVASKKENVLYQSCHILHKQGRYAITHFKELFALDGKPADITEDDIGRRNTIAALLEEWGLVTIVKKFSETDPRAPLSQIKVLAFKDKGKWTLTAKYQVGRRKG